MPTEPTIIRLASTPPVLHHRICPRQNITCIVRAGSAMPPGRSLGTSDRRFSSPRQTYTFGFRLCGRCALDQRLRYATQAEVACDRFLLAPDDSKPHTCLALLI